VNTDDIVPLVPNAYYEGEHAYRDGKPDTDNPYPEDSDEALDWEDGWYDAMDEDGSN
jgi:hypothetical protein